MDPTLAELTPLGLAAAFLSNLTPGLGVANAPYPGTNPLTAAFTYLVTTPGTNPLTSAYSLTTPGTNPLSTLQHKPFSLLHAQTPVTGKPCKCHCCQCSKAND